MCNCREVIVPLFVDYGMYCGIGIHITMLATTRKKMEILKKIVDVIYGTNRVRRKYAKRNPDEKIWASDASKAIITKEDKDLERGIDWVKSQRAVLLLTDKKLICGKWKIRISEIENANLIKVKTIFGGGQVLKIKTSNDDHYQFGMQINKEWETQLVLPLNIENGKINYSKFSIAIRIFILLYLVYWIIEKIK